MVIQRGLRRLVAGLSTLVLSSVLLVSPAQAASALKATDFFNPAKILRIDLDLPAPTVEALNDPQTFRTYVPGVITMSVDGRTSGDLDMDIRLKGTTSISELDATPSFKIKFPKGASGTGYLGQRRLTLNALTQDTSKIHEYGAYALFNAMGVPASKTGWARVYVNGVDRGLYLNVEQPDENFMAKRFKDITQHVYEGVAVHDFKPGKDYGDNVTGAFLADYGWKVTPNKNDLTKFIAVANNINSASWYKSLETYADRPALIKFMAVENFLGHWDGYTGPNVNNYFIRSNTRGKFTFIPWGADQTFGENRRTKSLGDTFLTPMLASTSTHPWSQRETARGMLYTKCITYTVCRTAYLTELKAVSAMATKMKLGTLMKSAAAVIKPLLLNQFPAGSEELQIIEMEQARSIAFITTRQKEVAALVKTYKIK
ncbi:MAG: CotH kinase family protein [Rhodoluna sp.]|nr:CotH kinase family protein [Rhodoluna sp.]